MEGSVHPVVQIHDPTSPNPAAPSIQFFGPTRTLTVTTGQIVTASAEVSIYTRSMTAPGLFIEICQEAAGASHPYAPAGTFQPAPTAVGEHTTVTPVVSWYMTAGTYEIGLCGASGSFADDFDVYWSGYIQLSDTGQGGGL